VTATRRETYATLWRLGWPLAITLQLASAVEMIVVFWLGRLEGPRALATEATLRYVFLSGAWLFNAMGAGVAVLVSHSVGAKDGKGLGYVAQGARLSLVALAVVALIAAPLSGPISQLLASPQVDAMALRGYFLAWLLCTLPGIAMVQLVLFAASGAGWTRLYLSRILVDLALTTVTVPLVVRVLGAGVLGAPIAQGIAQLVVAVFVGRALWRERARWQLGELPRVRTDLAVWREILNIGLPPQVARIAMLAAYAYLAQRAAADGRDAIAAYGIALTVLFMGFGISSGLGRAVGIVIGQRLGAKQPDEAKRVLAVGMRFVIAVALGVGAALLAVAPWLPRVFTSDAAIVARAAGALRVVALALPFTAISQVLLNAYTAIKSTTFAAIAGIAADGAGIAFALLYPGDALDAVAWSIVVSNALRAASFALAWKW
jgi:MATE family, multidrug efflux pump